MSFTLTAYRSRDEMADAVADLLVERLRQRSAAGRVSMAVPGGSTPGPMLRSLGAADISWEKVSITLTDERWVPLSSDRSNQAMLAETLFQGPAAGAEFVPLYTATATPAEGIAAVNAALSNIVLPLDIAVLGMGADMHTASLFPGALGLEDALNGAAPAVAITAPGADEPRVTLSASVLRTAERHILIAGADKRTALYQAQDIGDQVRAPVLAVLPGATVHYAD